MPRAGQMQILILKMESLSPVKGTHIGEVENECQYFRERWVNAGRYYFSYDNQAYLINKWGQDTSALGTENVKNGDTNQQRNTKNSRIFCY